MDRRRLLGAGFAGVAAACLPALARAQRRLWRIGYYSAGTAQSNAGWLEAFRQGMAELGWSEARDYVIDARYADGVSEALPRLAAELVATQPDLLLTTAEGSLKVLGQATKAIPIVFTVAGDPVRHGFVAGLQRPAGNMTGLTILTHDLAAKRLQMLKEAFPLVSHVAVLFQANHDASVAQAKEYENASAPLQLRVTLIELRAATDIDAAYSRASALGANAYAITSSFLMNVERKAIVERSLRAKVPSMGPNVIWAEAGLLMAYSPSVTQNFRRAAVYVDKILKGAKPGDLPIEQPTKFELAINIRTAKALGLQIPQSLLLRADRVIE